MSDTPRTDKVAETVANVYGGGTVVPVEFARELERELAIANARIDYLMSPDSSLPEGRPIVVPESEFLWLVNQTGRDGDMADQAVNDVLNNWHRQFRTPPQIGDSK